MRSYHYLLGAGLMVLMSVPAFAQHREDPTALYVQDWYLCAIENMNIELRGDKDKPIAKLVDQTMGKCKAEQAAYSDALREAQPTSDAMHDSSVKNLRDQIIAKLNEQFEPQK